MILALGGKKHEKQVELMDLAMLLVCGGGVVFMCLMLVFGRDDVLSNPPRSIIIASAVFFLGAIIAAVEIICECFFDLNKGDWLKMSIRKT